MKGGRGRYTHSFGLGFIQFPHARRLDEDIDRALEEIRGVHLSEQESESAVKDPITRDMIFLLLFGVLPATGLMLGGVYVGGWVLGEDVMPWAAFAIIGGVVAAFGWIKFAVDMVYREIARRAAERNAELIRRLGLG